MDLATPLGAGTSIASRNIVSYLYENHIIDEPLFTFDMTSEEDFIEFGSYNRDLKYAWLEVMRRDLNDWQFKLDNF